VRIVSLLPAATDFVAVLGRLDDLVGRTHECDWPEEVGAVPTVTAGGPAPNLSSREISRASAHHGSGLYALDTALLAELDPDVVLTQDLCEVCAVSYRTVSHAVRILNADATVISLEPHTLAGVLDCLDRLGDALGVPDRATAVRAELTNRIATVRCHTRDLPRPRVAVLEWLDPVWPAGHWVPEQVTLAGGVPLLAAPGEHTGAIEWQAVLDAEPDVLLLAPCGFAPERTLAELNAVTDRPGYADLPAVRDNQVWVLDGPAYFNRPGPRVVRGVEVLAHVLHGVPADPPVTGAEAVNLG
jgi:iron complex transport system substrate-binding protein